jgi:hypothetical protein
MRSRRNYPHPPRYLFLPYRPGRALAHQGLYYYPAFWLQIFSLMDLTLKGTDPENPVIWLRGIPRTDLVDVLRERVNEARQHNRLYELN